MNLLADVVIRSSIVLLAGLGAALLLRRRSAAFRHAVLAAALFGAAAVVPLGLVLPAWTLRIPAVVSSPAASRPAAAHTASAPESDKVMVAPDPAARGGPLLSAVVLGIWIGGVAVGAAALLAGFGRLRRLASRAVRVRDARWIRLAEEIGGAHGLKRPVTLLLADGPSLLATWGLLHPRVLLPSHARAWSADRLRTVLCHELAHVRRCDWLVQILAEALRTACWINPLFWIVCARLRRESEQACDDLVLAAGVPADEYAADLLELARSVRSGPAWASAMLMARPSSLERRIAAMLNPRLNRARVPGRAAALTAVVLAVLTILVATGRALQTGPQPLTGSVYDPTGAVLPGVELKLTDAQQIEYQAVTDASGHFEFPAVGPGPYDLRASLPGFKALRQDLTLQKPADWDRAITLQVGTVTETITVSSRRPATLRPRFQGSGPQPVRVGGNIRPPRKLRDVRPVYPEAMREAGLEGLVPLEAIIAVDGSVASARVVSANVHPDFANAALDAVRQWQFSPTLLNGEPVEVMMTVSVRFSLDEK